MKSGNPAQQLQRIWKTFELSEIDTREEAEAVVRECGTVFYAAGVVGFLLALASYLHEGVVYALFAFFLERFKSRAAALGLLLFSATALMGSTADLFKEFLGRERCWPLALLVLIWAVRAVMATFKLHRGQFAQTPEPSALTGSLSRAIHNFRQEVIDCWRQMPARTMALIAVAAWLALFQFLGNSTLGYIHTPSLFGWLEWVYANSADDEHGKLIPLAVLVLFWWKRKELMAVTKRNWWPALFLLALGILFHVLGYMIQQARFSVVGFFIGLYGLTGVVWGPHWLRRSFFPFLIFAFCLPLSGGPSEQITVPLRHVATRITTLISQGVLGINVIQNGTQIFDANGTYQYEVAAACSGIRSLTATLAFSVIYGFVVFKAAWKRTVMVGAAVPLAVAGNVLRLTTIIVAAEAFGQRAGSFAHENFWLSLLPYIPAFGGILLLAHFLNRGKVSSLALGQPALTAAEQKS